MGSVLLPDITASGKSSLVALLRTAPSTPFPGTCHHPESRCGYHSFTCVPSSYHGTHSGRLLVER